MRKYTTAEDRRQFVANWYRTVENWQSDVRKGRN
jgi:DNA phosphorothioation-dependent restriction protein DptG